MLFHAAGQQFFAENVFWSKRALAGEAVAKETSFNHGKLDRVTTTQDEPAVVTIGGLARQQHQEKRRHELGKTDEAEMKGALAAIKATLGEMGVTRCGRAKAA